MTFALHIADQVILVDEADAALANSHTWHLKRGPWKTAYVQTRLRGRTGPLCMMHRMILGAENGVIVDHINGNGLDNRRANLRLCNRSQNGCNAGARTGRFKGVSPVKNGKYRAVIYKNYRQFHLGIYATEDAAALAYDAAAKELHGEFAKLNFPDSARHPVARRPAAVPLTAGHLISSIRTP